MLSDDAGRYRWRVAASGYQTNVILRAVERSADVVAHAAVDADVAALRRGAHVDVLNGAHLIKRDGSGPGDGPARFDHQSRWRQTDCSRLAAHNGIELRGEIPHR